ncbi:MAG: class I SAM-dependent methyltransferase [Dechloromonas sp.]|nr:MAG: class I SAM-dependent methyltransferase [Dechloromonas sp.]
MSQNAPLELAFSSKYDSAHALRYFHKHRDGVARRLSDWRDRQLARQALRAAGDPGLVLDLPCGAGRFWPLLAEHPNRVILAADNSQHMLDVALSRQPSGIVGRVHAFRTSAFAIDLDDGAVDCVFCMRLLHHLAEAEHRLAMLRECHRVTRDTLIVSLWVDGNYKAWRRRRLESRRAGRDGTENRNRFVVPVARAEAEFAAAGFEILGYGDFLPGYAMWRVYTLRKRP